MTPKDVLDANPGLARVQRIKARRIEERNARAVCKMGELVKAAKKGGDAVASVRVNDYDIADITAFLRDCAAQHSTGKLMDVVERTPGMLHGN